MYNSDLATLFTGRTFEIEVFPFSFSEFVDYYEYTNLQEAFDKYLIQGGMAESYVYKTQEDQYAYISNVYNTLVIRDIHQKYKIRNTLLFNRINDFLMDNISNLTSSRNISETLNRKEDTINHKTVGKYIDYLCNAFAFYKISRYDIQGKKYLSTNEKYYLSDHSFRFARLGTKNINYGLTIENIVAIELLRRGYEVYVGVLYKKK